MKRVFVLLVACASLLACESLALGQELQVGSPLRKSIAPGETHHYSVSAQVDQRIHVSVEQRGIDVVVRLFAPDGKKVAEIDGPTGATGAEDVVAFTSAAGKYRVSADRKGNCSPRETVE